jgi:hypothetical protein
MHPLLRIPTVMFADGTIFILHINYQTVGLEALY